MILMKTKLFITLLFITFCYSAQSQYRWKLESDGSIRWLVNKSEAHTDNIEMSGRFISVIVTYGIDEKGKMVSSKQLVFPMLRTIPITPMQALFILSVQMSLRSLK